jgi:hypothetical protein
MKRTFVMLAAMMLGAASLQAQMGAAAPATSISAVMNGDWQNISGLIERMGEKMPAENYHFKATPEVQEFGQRMAHILGAQLRTCETVKNDGKTLKFSDTPEKPEIMAAAKVVKAACDPVYASAKDADLMKPIGGGRGGPRPLFQVLNANLQHSQEVYGYMCPYLRLKGIVPPSSDRTEAR